MDREIKFRGQRVDKQDREWKLKQEKIQKNKIKQERTCEAKWCTWEESKNIKRLYKRIKSNEGFLRLQSTFANAFNFTNEMFGYKERIEVKSKNVLEIENDNMRLEIEKIKEIKKQKLKELKQGRVK